MINIIYLVILLISIFYAFILSIFNTYLSTYIVIHYIYYFDTVKLSIFVNYIYLIIDK